MLSVVCCFALLLSVGLGLVFAACWLLVVVCCLLCVIRRWLLLLGD